MRRRRHGAVGDGVADDGGDVVDFRVHQVVGHAFTFDHAHYTGGRHGFTPTAAVVALVVDLLVVHVVTVHVVPVHVVSVHVVLRVGFVQVEIDVQDGARGAGRLQVGPCCVSVHGRQRGVLERRQRFQLCETVTSARAGSGRRRRRQHGRRARQQQPVESVERQQLSVALHRGQRRRGAAEHQTAAVGAAAGR